MSLPEIVNGWFCVAFSHEIAPTRVRVVRFMGRTVVLFRVQSGRLVALDAPCAHLGASFERAGMVVGDELCCRDHGLRVDAAGVCREGRGKLLPGERRRSFHVDEQAGAVWLWHHHDGVAPGWRLPGWEDEGWGRARHTLFQIRGHAQDMIENGVDIGHLEHLHGGSSVDTGRLDLDGHRLTLHSGFTTSARLVGRATQSVRVDLQVDAFGLGLLVANSYLPSLGARIRFFVAPTPAPGGTTQIRCWVRLHEPAQLAARLPLVGRLLPRAAATRVMEELMHTLFVLDLGKDLRYLDNRRYLPRPSLGRRDLYIGTFRKWARQFYPAQLLDTSVRSSNVA